MLSAGITSDQGPIGPSQQALAAEQSVERLINLVEQHAPVEQIEQAQQQVNEALKDSPFKLQQQLPFFQQVIKKLDATLILQHFRLPGRERLVEDRREQFQGQPVDKEKAAQSKEAAQETAKQASKESAKEAAKDAAKGKHADQGKFLLKDGKLIEHRDRLRMGPAVAHEIGHAERGAATSSGTSHLDDMLSTFEKLVVARFEKGEQVGQQSVDGKARFLTKSDGEWRDFFKNFFDRTVKKKTLVDDIREFLFRGAVQNGNKGIFIGDMHLASGRVEKFVRFSVLAEALSQLKAMSPGDAVTASILGKLSGEELMYLALSAARSREFSVSMAPTQGKFALGSTEEKAAQALGIPVDRHLQQKAKQLRAKHGAAFGSLFEKDPEPEEIPYTFIPWWSWGNLHRPTPTRWITRVFYGALLIISLMGIVTLTARLLKGGF